MTSASGKVERALTMSLLRRARRKHDDSDEDDEDDIVEDVGSDVEMDDTRPSKPRRSDASEQGGRLSRAERLSARTKAKVCPRPHHLPPILTCHVTVGAAFNRE